jgi:hypothetical protein
LPARKLMVPKRHTPADYRAASARHRHFNDVKPRQD